MRVKLLCLFKKIPGVATLPAKEFPSNTGPGRRGGGWKSNVFDKERNSPPLNQIGDSHQLEVGVGFSSNWTRIW